TMIVPLTMVNKDQRRRKMIFCKRDSSGRSGSSCCLLFDITILIKRNSPVKNNCNSGTANKEPIDLSAHLVTFPARSYCIGNGSGKRSEFMNVNTSEKSETAKGIRNQPLE